MENFNKNFVSSTSIKPTSDARGYKSDNENEMNPELASRFKSPKKKQLPNKSFMNPTISATKKASSVPKKKILGERNETLDGVVVQFSLQRSSSFGSDSFNSSVVDVEDDKKKDLVGSKSCMLQPYDPVKNYLSPRPKFLRYDPNRRRRILNLQENDDDRVKISTYFNAGSDVPPVSESQDSCSQQESVEETDIVNGEEVEECESEDDEEEIGEFGGDGCCSLKGFFKFVLVVIALVFTTQAICSMNDPSPLKSIDSVCGFNRSVNHVHGLNFFEVGNGVIKETVFSVERLKEEGVHVDDDNVEYETVAADDNNVHQVEAELIETVSEEFVESNAIQNEILQDDEFKESSEVVERDTNGAETVEDLNQDGVIEEEDSNDAELDIANDMEAAVEEELDDVATNDDVLIKYTSSDLMVAILLGHILALTCFGVIYRSRCCNKVEKEEFKELEPSTNPQLMKEEEQFVPPRQNGVFKETKQLHIPSVELLNEFVFGEEITSSMSQDIQTPAVSSCQTETSQTVKKQRRKNAEVVTPSPVSVRRSSRLKSRSAVMSP